MKHFISLLFGLLILQLGATAQNTSPFSISLESSEISGLGGIQSFAFGQHDGKWLIVGGRLDGLHRRQPWASFDVAGHNNQFIVVDPIAQKQWSAPLSTLPQSIQEQLSSTNMEFIQEGDYLYCVGGYGYSSTVGDHTTYGSLTAIKVPDVIDAVINNTSFTPHVRQINDPQFQVTGGRLKKIYDTYYLLGGQKFLGRYNPNNGPSFTQEYTNAVRKFKINDNDTTILIEHLPSYTHADHLHRRDYNAEPQILPNGEQSITMFSGVFQKTVDLPYLNAVHVDSSSFSLITNFQQYYNHYHCAVVPLYDADANEMHTLFFGGIAQYYDSLGTLVQDNNVPFVNTIARVTRDANGHMAEYKLPVEMPALLGAGSEFIPNKDLPHYSNEVFKLHEFDEDSVLLGYVFGGINSSAPNIFFINNGTQSSASAQIFKVYLSKGTTNDLHELNDQSTGMLNLTVFPNPSTEVFELRYRLSSNTDVWITITDISGRVIEREEIKNQKSGEHSYTARIESMHRGQHFFVTLETPTEKVTRKVVLKR